MSRTSWTAAAGVAALVPSLFVAVAAAPAQAAPASPAQLRPANQRLTVSAPVAAKVAAQGAAAAKSTTSAEGRAAAPSPLKLTQSCDPATIAVQQSTTCTVTAENTGSAEIAVNLASVSSLNLPITAATGAATFTPFLAYPPKVALQGTRPAGPSSVAADPGNIFGYIPLTAFGGNTVIPVGDEELKNLDVPGFVFNGTTYTKVGISSNGYLVAGGGAATDQATPGAIPDPATPNNIIAPFWTDLDGSGTTGVLTNVLTDGVASWLVVEWQENVAGTSSLRVFQAWVGINGVQDIQYAYRFDTIADAGGLPIVVGAENASGTVGVRLPAGTLPGSDLRVVSNEGQPGGKLTYTVTLKGVFRGPGQLATAASIAGTTLPITTTTAVTVQR